MSQQLLQSPDQMADNRHKYIVYCVYVGQHTETVSPTFGELLALPNWQKLRSEVLFGTLGESVDRPQ